MTADDNNNDMSWDACKAAIADTHGDTSLVSNDQLVQRLLGPGGGLKYTSGLTPEGYYDAIANGGSPCENLLKQLPGLGITREFNRSAPDNSPKPDGPVSGFKRNNGPKVT